MLESLWDSRTNARTPPRPTRAVFGFDETRRQWLIQAREQEAKPTKTSQLSTSKRTDKSRLTTLLGGITTRMGWLGLQVAKLFGERLPAFASQTEAEAELFRQRDERLQRLYKLAASSGVFTADHTPDSLKALEAWYFELWKSGGFGALGVSREEFERCMAMYFCEVIVRSCPDAKWEVREYGFERGKYELGVQRGLSHLMRSRFTDHYSQPNNKRRQKIYREYQQYAT